MLPVWLPGSLYWGLGFFMQRHFFLILLLILLFAQGAEAQGQPDTTVTLPTVTVTATRGHTRLAMAPARVTVLDAEAVASTGAQTVADLLTARTGIFVRRYGDGGLASLSLRGTSASQTLILLDGHRIADPQLGQLDLSLLPTLLLESAEVMAGTGSSLYGTDALGGVVNLRALPPGGETSLKVRGGYGAFGERTGGMLATGSQGAFSGLALVDYEVSEGDYLYVNKGLFPPQEVPREGADRDRLSLYSSLAYAEARNSLRLTAWYNDAERGLPTIGATRSRNERQWDRHLRLWADGERRTRWGTLRVGGLVQEGTLRYVNPQLDLDETGRTLITSADAEARAVLGRHWLLAGGLAGGYGRARHPGLQDDAMEVHGGAFVHGTGSFGPLLVYPALRADVYNRHDTSAVWAVNPRLGLNVRLLPQTALHLKAGVGRSFRMPTFNDRFWQPGGKPDLAPEHGWTYDLGVRWEHHHHQAEVTAFLSHIRDQIVWEPTPSGYHAPDNVRRVRSRGIEASYRWRWPLARRLHLDGSLFYTLTEARDRSDAAARSFDQQVRFVPRHQLKSHLGLRLGPVFLDVAGRYTGRRFITTDGTEALDPYLLLDAQARLSRSTRWVDATLALFVENLLDRRYEVIPANPMPPRHARLQLTLTFH